MTIELDIVRLGAQGDGIAETDNGPRYVPFALPGERVRLAGQRHARSRFGCQQRSCGAGLPSLRHLRRLRRAAHERPSLCRLEAQHRRRCLSPARTSARVAPLRRIALGLAAARGAHCAPAKQDGSVSARLSPPQEHRSCRHRRVPDPGTRHRCPAGRAPVHRRGDAGPRNPAHRAADARRLGHLHQPRRSPSRPGGNCWIGPDCRAHTASLASPSMEKP